jgi:hypothetical protein
MDEAITEPLLHDEPDDVLFGPHGWDPDPEPQDVDDDPFGFVGLPL